MPGAPKHLGATHYELLVRALAMLAELATNFNERRRYLLLGAHFATSLYNLHVRGANSVAHKEQKDAARAARKAGEEYATPEGPKFSGLESLCDWASLELSTELLDHCKRAQNQKRQARNVVSQKTCAKVPLTAHHLCALSDGLCDLGYTIQALAPTVCLQLVGYLATTHEATPALAVLGGCRRARLLLELGATQSALKQLRALGGLGLTSKNEAEAPDATDVERLLEQRKTTEPVSKKEPTEWKVRGLETRHIWCAIASECVSLEQPGAAATYLAGAYKHNDAFDDRKGAGRCAEVAAHIAYQKGEFKEAVMLVMAAQHAVGKTGDLRTWTRTCLHCVKYHLCDGNKKAAKALLVKITALVRSACTKDDAPLDSVVCWAQLELLLCSLDAPDAHEKNESAKNAVARIHRI